MRSWVILDTVDEDGGVFVHRNANLEFDDASFTVLAAGLS